MSTESLDLDQLDALASDWVDTIRMSIYADDRQTKRELKDGLEALAAIADALLALLARVREAEHDATDHVVATTRGEG